MRRSPAAKSNSLAPPPAAAGAAPTPGSTAAPAISLDPSSRAMEAIWATALLLAVGSIFTSNPLLTAASFLVLPILVKLLWRQGEAPLLLFCALGQWFQVAAPVLLADFHLVKLAGQFGVPFHEKATWLGLMAVLTVAGGMRLALMGCRATIGPQAEREMVSGSVERLFAGWALASVLNVPVLFIVRFVPGIFQIIQPVTELSLGVAFLLGYAVFRQKRGLGYFAFVILFEFFVGTLGYFGGFRSVFNMLVILMATLTRRWTLSLSFLSVLLISVMLWSGTLWTAIKPEYRAFLNQGSGQQEVTVPVTDRIQFLRERLPTVDRTQFDDAFETLFVRLGYTDYLGYTLENVPAVIPHQNGRLWWEAVAHVLMPRMFFREKAEVHDSYRTREYAGVLVAGPDEGASIGLGYVAESYVDFGVPLMFLPILLLGLLLGWLMRQFVLRPNAGAWGYVIAFALPIVSSHLFETSNVKIVGRAIACVICFVALEYLAGARLRYWLLGNTSGLKPARAKKRQKEPQRRAPLGATDSP